MSRDVGSNVVFANLGLFSGLKIAAGITIAIALSTYFSGILWTVILGLSVVAVMKALPCLLNDGDEDQANSFENLYNSDENSPKQRRMLAKKKVNHLRRSRQSKTDFESPQNTSGINLSSQILEELEFSVAEDFNSTRKWPQNGNHRQQIPSLRSPQPLLSAVKTRICIRDSKRSSPIHPFGNKYPDRPRREVLRDVKNASAPNSVQLFRDSLLASGRSQDIFKAMSPPSGRYFSRINPDKTLNNPEAITLSPLSDSILEQTWSKAKKTEERTHEDSCSREAVVKALQEKITSKRKRNLQSHADLSFDSTIDQTNMLVKKRRLDTDIMDSSTDDIFPSYFKDNIQKNEISQNVAPKAVTKRSSETDHEVNKRKKIVKSSVIENSTSKYGMKDSEIDLISDEDDMIEVPNKQNKQKSKIPIKASKKGKKETVIKGATLSKIAKTMVKKTPVKSVETQTPSKLETEANDEVKNPKILKTPYRKIFSSGFPSNLKPGSTEKRRRIPIYTMSAGDLEVIEISREEYGERGVTSEVFQAAKRAAAERASKMLDDHEDEQPTTTSPSSSSISSTISTSGLNMVQSSAASSLPPASISLTATTAINTGFTVIKEGTAANSGDSKVKSILFGKQLSPSKTEISFGTPQTAVSSSSIVKPFGGGNGLGFGLTDSSAASQSAKTLNAAIPSSLGFNKPTEPSQSKVATGIGGFTFGNTASTNLVISSCFPSTASGFAATTTSGFAATTHGFAATTSGFAATTSGFAATAPGFAATTTGFVSTTPGFAATTTGFASTTTGLASTFGFSAAAKPGLAALSSSSTTALLGTSSNVKRLPAQPSLTPKSLVAQQAQASAQHAQSVAPQLGGFSMGPQSIVKSDIPKPFSAQTQATAALPSATSSTQSFGGFSFGAASAQKPSVGGFSFGNSSVAASSATAAGFNFNASTASTSSTLPTSSSGGGFSFGAPISSQQAPATASFGAKSTPATSAPFGGFSLGAAKTQTGFTFGNTSTVTTKNAPQNPIPVPFGTPTASTQNGSASIFSAAAAAPSASNLFGQKGSDAPATSNLFGTKPQSSVAPAPIFGAASQPSGSVFGSVPQTAKASAPLFGSPAQSTASKAPLFGAVSQNPATSTLFGAKPSPATTSVTPFGASNAAPSLSFGSKSTNIFGAPTSQTPSTGGFSFTNSPQTNPASGAQNLFGQTGANAGAKFSFGQSASNSNPFSGSSAFGQPAANPPATTAAFAFGQSATPSFGQPVATQSSFGASAAPAFGNNANQTQSGGFSFGSAPKPNLGGFAFSSGAASGGFTSRPGTPTPLAGNQPVMQAPGGMPGSMFGTPQPQGSGFALGSGSTANRQQIKGKRRTRR